MDFSKVYEENKLAVIASIITLLAIVIGTILLLSGGPSSLTNNGGEVDNSKKVEVKVSKDTLDNGSKKVGSLTAGGDVTF